MKILKKGEKTKAWEGVHMGLQIYVNILIFKQKKSNKYKT